jgi:hypothetical protein
MQLDYSAGKQDSRVFLAGLMDWSGADLPDAEAIENCGIVEQGCVHIKTITANRGQILGFRPLDADGLEPWLFLSQASPGPNCYLQRGCEQLRLATSDEQHQYKSLSTWGYQVIVLIAEDLFGG